MSDAEDLSINWGPGYAQPSDEPMVHIYSDGDARLNAAAGRQYFPGDEIAVGAAPGAGLLVFDPDCEQTDQTLQIHRDAGEDGGELSCTSRTRQLLDLDTLEETLRVPIVERDDGLLVADVGAVLADDDDEPTVSQAAPESGSTYATPEETETIEAAVGEDAVEEADGEDGDEDDEGESAEEQADADLPFEPGFTNRAAVERVLAEKLSEHDAVTVTAADIAEQTDVHVTWVGRTINELGELDAPISVDRDHHDEAKETTLYHVAYEGDRDSDAASPESDDGPAVVDLDALGCSEIALQNAITGATNVLDVRRELGLDRERATAVLDALDLLEELDSGRSPVQQHEVRSALRATEVRG